MNEENALLLKMQVAGLKVLFEKLKTVKDKIDALTILDQIDKNLERYNGTVFNCLRSHVGQIYDKIPACGVFSDSLSPSERTAIKALIAEFDVLLE